MESWSFGSERKVFLFSEEMDIPIDAFAGSRKALQEWDNKTCFNFGKESVDSMEFMELGLPDMVRKPFHINQQGVETLSGGLVVSNDFSNNTVASPPTFLISSSSSLGEGESLSSPVSESNTNYSQDSSLIALKLGRLADSKDGQNSQHLKERSKRVGLRGSYSQNPTCQVYGCNMDLSCSKDYHKRHRVCDAHSKTPKVIVNGIEQRFCQQCSRFHLLAEFDDVKRSCRRRLAGHNERRRKPQLDAFNCKPHKLFRSCQGTRYLGTSFPKTAPFVFSDILPGGILYPEEYEQTSQYGHVKSEAESTYSQCVTPIANRQSLPISFHLHGLGKQQAPRIPSSGNEYSAFDAASTIQKASGSLNSGCALSLLSAESHNLSSHSAGVQVPSPLIMQSTHPSIGQLYEKPSRMNSMEKGGQNGSYPCSMNSMGVDQMESVIDSSHAVDFQPHSDRVFQESDYWSTKYCLSPEGGSTSDLLQLSLHLQRVEHERNIFQANQEHGEFYCFPTA